MVLRKKRKMEKEEKAGPSPYAEKKKSLQEKDLHLRVKKRIVKGGGGVNWRRVVLSG